MKKVNTFALIALLTPLLSSCDAIAGIFEAGVWTGFILVAVGIAVVLWLGAKLFRRR